MLRRVETMVVGEVKIDDVWTSRANRGVPDWRQGIDNRVNPSPAREQPPNFKHRSVPMVNVF